MQVEVEVEEEARGKEMDELEKEIMTIKNRKEELMHELRELREASTKRKKAQVRDNESKELFEPFQNRNLCGTARI